MSTLKKGFTLIELLVVIAIIAILSTVVLASLGSARARAADAKVQATISGARAQAEIYASANNNSYTGVCTSTSAESLLAMFNSLLGTAGVDKRCQVSPDGSQWVLNSNISGARLFCADSTGKAEITTTNNPATGGYSC